MPEQETNKTSIIVRFGPLLETVGLFMKLAYARSVPPPRSKLIKTWVLEGMKRDAKKLSAADRKSLEPLFKSGESYVE